MGSCLGDRTGAQVPSMKKVVGVVVLVEVPPCQRTRNTTQKFHGFMEAQPLGGGNEGLQVFLCIQQKEKRKVVILHYVQ